APKGALSPSLAACMAALGRYGRGGVFLDPFAGSGALGKARLDLGGAERVILSDKDPEKVGTMKRRLRGLASDKLVIRRADALALGRDWAEGPVQELVCDPPWGQFEPLPMPAPAFYSGMLASFDAVMAPGGRLVVLTADKAAFAQALNESVFEPRERHDILVNGQKAGIFLSVKRESG
ncbi:MAG TPA: RsmD family RNA methyltransferase, partial [Clostridia bacterium]|nr:RsmD family RNA methyltransferase [Clostridia bacterium]